MKNKSLKHTKRKAIGTWFLLIRLMCFFQSLKLYIKKEKEGLRIEGKGQAL